MDESIFGVDNSSLWNLKRRFVFRKTRRIKNLANPLLTLSLPEVKSSRASMGKDMSSDRFFGVSMSHGVSRIGHHLVCHVDSNIELFRKFHELAQNLSQDLLSFRKLASSSVVISKHCHDGVHDEKRVRTFHHHRSCKVQKSDQVLHSIPPRISNVFKRLLRVQLVPFSNFGDSFRPERSLSVNVYHFSVSSAFLSRELSSDTKSVGKLSFSCSELPKSLCDSHRLYPPS